MLDELHFVASSQVRADELSAAGRLDEAVAALERALPVCRQQWRRGQVSGRTLGNFLEHYARLLREDGRHDEALLNSREAVKRLQRRGLRRRPPDQDVDLGTALWGLTEDLTALGRFNLAIRSARDAVSAWQSAVDHGVEHVEAGVGASYDRLALALGRKGRWEEALAASRRAVDVFASDGRGPDLEGSLEHLAEAYAALGREDEAAETRARAAALP
jgi:tetratricopeptide (TPR) repeat protein